MRRTLVSALALCAVAAIVLLRTAPAVAADEKPAKGGEPFVTVSFAGYDKAMQEIGLLGKLAGDETLPKMLEGVLQQQFGEEGLNALDKSKPWGLTVKAGDGPTDFVFQGFIPAKDPKAFFEALKKVDVEATAGEGGVWEIQTPAMPIHAKQLEGGWLVLSNKKEALTVSGSPDKLLGGLNEKYLLGVALAVKNVPEATKQQVMMPLQMIIQMSQMQRMPGESDEQSAARRKATEAGMQQLAAMINDLDTITIGTDIDQKTQTGIFEYVITAKPGTETAKQMAQAGQLKSDFVGLIAGDATVGMHAVGKIDATAAAQVKTSLASARSNVLSELEKQGLSEEQAKKAKEVVGDLMDVLEKTFESGTIDVAAMLKLIPKNSSFVAGARVAEGAKLENAIKQLIEQVGKDQPEVAKAIKLDAEEHGGVKFHVLTVPVEQLGGDASQGLKATFGDKLAIILGTSANSVYLAVGQDPSKDLKQAIDQAKAQAGKAVPPFQLTVATLPITRFAASVAEREEPKQKAEQVAKILESASGKDHIRIISTAVPNGGQVRFELEQGILKLIGSIPKLAQGG